MVNDTIKFKRFNGSSGNPPFIFAQGEPVYDFYNKRVKLGDDTNTWGSLLEFAMLNANGKIPVSMIDGEIIGGMQYKGAFDPATGTAPTPASQGYYYISTGVGTVSGLEFATGDWLVYRDTIVWDKIDNSEPVTLPIDSINISIPTLGSSPTYTTLTDYLNITGFTGKISGGTITDGGSGNASIAAGTGFIRTTTSDVSAIKSFDWEATTVTTLVDNAINYIYIAFNAGVPLITSTTNRDDILYANSLFLGRVYRSGTSLNIINTGVEVSNLLTKINNRDVILDGFAHVSGAVVSTTGLKIATSAGKFYLGLETILTPDQDTNGTDTFNYWYRDGSTGWITSEATTDINTTNYDNNSGTLAAINDNKYGVNWVYILYDGSIHIQYGQSGSYSLAAAQAALVPEAPTLLKSFGVLAAKLIYLKSNTSINEVQSSWITSFSFSAPSDHASLSNLDYTNSGHTGFVPEAPVDDSVYVRRNSAWEVATISGGDAFTTGTATINAGYITTTITHGIEETPTMIEVVPDCNITEVGATTFKISIVYPQSTNTTFNWRAI